jgi:hypothetical protein
MVGAIAQLPVLFLCWGKRPGLERGHLRSRGHLCSGLKLGRGSCDLRSHGDGEALDFCLQGLRCPGMPLCRLGRQVCFLSHEAYAPLLCWAHRGYILAHGLARSSSCIPAKRCFLFLKLNMGLDICLCSVSCLTVTHGGWGHAHMYM